MLVTNNTGVSGAITVYVIGLAAPAAAPWQYLTSATTGAVATLPASGTAIPGFALPANGCIDLPPLISARVYLALGGAQFSNFVSNGSGSGAGGVAPWAPTQANANINVVYDFLEYTWTSTSSSFGLDVTQVDALGIPISFQAVNSSGSPAASPLYGMKPNAVTNIEADLNTLGSTWTGLIQQTGTGGVSRVISPQHAYNIPADGASAPSMPYPAGAPTFGNVNYWNASIAAIWGYYQGTNFLAMSYNPFGTAYGVVNPSTNTFNFYSAASTSSTLLGSVPYPTTWDVFNNAGAFAANATGTYGINLGRALVVNIERGTLPLPVPLYSTWPPASELQPFCNGLTNGDWANFYGGPPTNGGKTATVSVITNWYSALMHKYGQQPISSLPGLAYAFPDDDECQAAGGNGLYAPFYAQSFTAGEQWNVTLNPF